MDRTKAKNETVLGLGRKERWPPNFSAIKGRKLNADHSVDVQLNSVHHSIPPSLLQPLVITVLGPCIWDFSSWLLWPPPWLWTSLTSQTQQIPFNSISSKSPPCLDAVSSPTFSNTQSTVFIGLQSYGWFKELGYFDLQDLRPEFFIHRNTQSCCHFLSTRPLHSAGPSPNTTIHSQHRPWKMVLLSHFYMAGRRQSLKQKRSV